MIEDAANRIWISPVTIWELEMKRVVGKLRWTGDLLAESLGRGALELPITLQHARRAARLPRHHTDPFDRMLVAQAQLEGLKLLTADREISRYEIEILPARD